MSEFLKKIKPKNQKDGSPFSFNLWKYLKNHHGGLACSVWLVTDPVMPEGPRVYVIGSKFNTGYQGVFLKKLLNGIDTYPYFLEKEVIEQGKDVTGSFWTSYIRIGRCLFDPEHKVHFQNGQGRFTEINKHSRKCNWCGLHQRREIKTMKFTKRIPVWVNLES